MIVWLALTAATVASEGYVPTDPRIEWTELQRAGDLDAAQRSVAEHLESARHPEAANCHYLNGLLLARLGKAEPAADALAAALVAEPEIAEWARFRLAEIESSRDHPEVAAGLLATLLGKRPEAELAKASARLLASAVEQGGDCRVLAGADGWKLEVAERRLLTLTRAECRRPTDPTAAYRDIEALLEEDTSDGVAYDAALVYSRTVVDPPPSVSLQLANAFFSQRRFDQALAYFAAALDPALASAEIRSDFPVLYSVARSHFWLGDYEEAERRFAELVTLAADPGERADAHYQRARALELDGRQAEAEEALRAVRLADPDSGWAGSALVAGIRHAWLDGRQDEAIELYRELGERRRWRSSRARAALFLAASDLSAGRADRAGSWLSIAAATPGTHRPELSYWQGRWAELEGRAGAAVRAYLAALADDPYDPWSLAGRQRLGDDFLRPETERLAAQLATGSGRSDLYRSWLLARPGSASSEALARLKSSLQGESRARSFMALAPAPTGAWPLWRATLTSPAERLLAVGDWQFGRRAATEHFPSTSDPLSLTRAQLLAEADLPRSAILAGELLVRRAAGDVPQPLWPVALRKALYPLAFGDRIVAETTERGIDPRLLAGLIREESRFDANAVSAAAARGLTQFVLPTARRIADELGIERLESRDLFEPEIAIRLGAAYVEELARRFGPRPHQVLAAYNAGEPQSELWRSYCVSDEPAEFLTKIGFRETRGYVRKVLRSYAIYRELYPVLPTRVSGTAPSTSSK